MADEEPYIPSAEDLLLNELDIAIELGQETCQAILDAASESYEVTREHYEAIREKCEVIGVPLRPREFDKR